MLEPKAKDAMVKPAAVISHRDRVTRVRCTSLNSGCQRDETESVDQNLFLSHRHVFPRECFNQRIDAVSREARLSRDFLLPIAVYFIDAQPMHGWIVGRPNLSRMGAGVDRPSVLWPGFVTLRQRGLDWQLSVQKKCAQSDVQPPHKPPH